MEAIDRDRTIVVGGGLAGLAAATLLTRAGRRVVLLERASRPGGRASSRTRAGFVLNQGPHALYAGGAARRVLTELGVAWTGRKPPSRGYALQGNALHALPAGAWTGLTSRALGWPGKWELARFIASLSRTDPDALEGVCAADWIRRSVSRDDSRRLVEAIVRVATYGGEPDALSARVALSQTAMAVGAGVFYLDGGWQTLVDALAAAATAAGAEIRTNATVTEVLHDARVRGVRLEDGTTVHAGAVVLAVPPRVASRLVAGGAHHVLAPFAAEAAPERAATLDLGLARLPRPSRAFVLGVDTPVYLSVHSATARLAPPGGAMVHAARYLGTGEADAQRDRAEIEALLDHAQPGWRGEVVTEQWLPSMVVHHALPRADRGGLASRPTPEVEGVDGLFVAGDWVGNEGLLADAALSSARAVAISLSKRASSSRAA